MANVLKNVWKMINMNGSADEIEDEDEDLVEEEELEVMETQKTESKNIFGMKSNKNVVSMNQPVKMIILQPTTYEQSADICNLLREKKSIIMNLEFLNKDIARRIIDVVSGAVKVLDAHMEKVSNSIFLVAPYHYDIVLDQVNESKAKVSPVAWLKTN